MYLIILEARIGFLQPVILRLVINCKRHHLKVSGWAKFFRLPKVQGVDIFNSIENNNTRRRED